MELCNDDDDDGDGDGWAFGKDSEALSYTVNRVPLLFFVLIRKYPWWSLYCVCVCVWVIEKKSSLHY